jgi:hypothetical protein
MALDAGRLPEPSSRDDVVRTSIEAGLLLHLQPHERGECQPVPAPAELVLSAGTSIPLTAAVTITYTGEDGTESIPLGFAPAGASDTVVSYADDVHVRVLAAPATEIVLCDPDGAPFAVLDGP